MGEQQVDWLERLERENGNLAAAISWALEAQDAEMAARMGWALWQFWWVRGYQREGRRWMDAALRRELSPPVRAKALVAAATLAFGSGDYERCERYAEESLELSPRVGDKLQSAWAQAGLGIVAMTRTDPESATPYLEEALRSFRELGADFGVARMTTCLGMVALMRGEEHEATPIFEEGLAVARRIGDRTSAYVTIFNLAVMALSRGDHDDAVALLEEGVILSEQIRDRANVAYCLQGLATVAGARGEAERCARLVGAAEGLLEAVGTPVYYYYDPDPSLYEHMISATRSRLGEANFEKVRAEGRAMNLEQAVEYALDDDEASSP